MTQLEPILEIISVEVSRLKPWKQNARKHSKKQIVQIANSIKEFGFTNPVLIDEDHRIMAGHGRVAAAQSLGLLEVPCAIITHMTQSQKRAYVLAGNQLALNACWDEDLLAKELADLAAIDLDFDLQLTGFSLAEIDTIFEIGDPEVNYDPSLDHLPKACDARVSVGDIWELGAHRLVCGDSLDEHVVAELMSNERATMIFTDPPYNVPIDGHVSGKGSNKHREFAMASGEMSHDEFVQFLSRSFANLTRFAKEGSIHFICMDWRHISEVSLAADGIYAELKNLIVWAKESGGMGTFYRSRHELIFAFKLGKEAHLNNFELGQYGRYRTNVWQYPGASGEDLKLHPTVKPAQMIADAMRDVSGRGDIVLDLFGGSGSTLIAAEQTGRRSRMCEIDPLYCDIILARYEAFSKDEARKVGEITPQSSGLAAE